jgi:hypothetical protein
MLAMSDLYKISVIKQLLRSVIGASLVGVRFGDIGVDDVGDITLYSLSMYISSCVFFWTAMSGRLVVLYHQVNPLRFYFSHNVSFDA